MRVPLNGSILYIQKNEMKEKFQKIHFLIWVHTPFFIIQSLFNLECTCLISNISTDTLNTPSFCYDNTTTKEDQLPKTTTTDDINISNHDITRYDVIKVETGVEFEESTTSSTLDVVLDKRMIDSLVNRLRMWFNKYPFIRQGFFAKNVLSRSQGTLSSLLKWRGIPTSKSGQEVWYKIYRFLEDSKQQQDLIAEHRQTKFRGNYYFIFSKFLLVTLVVKKIEPTKNFHSLIISFTYFILNLLIIMIFLTHVKFHVIYN